MWMWRQTKDLAPFHRRRVFKTGLPKVKLPSKYAGGFTLNEPSTAGQTKKKLFISTSATEAIIQIGDSEIVS